MFSEHSRLSNEADYNGVQCRNDSVTPIFWMVVYTHTDTHTEYFSLWAHTFIHVFMGSILSSYQYKNHKSGQVLHTGPLNNWIKQNTSKISVKRRQDGAPYEDAITFWWGKLNAAYTALLTVGLLDRSPSSGKCWLWGKREEKKKR